MSHLEQALNDHPFADASSFAAGWSSALEAILSDDTYYNAINASPSAYAALEEAVEHIR